MGIEHWSDCDGNTQSCWACGGEGGHHDCGEDCCCCLSPTIDVDCEVCGGRGVLVCPGCVYEDEVRDGD